MFGVAMTYSMCTGGAGCEAPGVLMGKAALLVLLVLVLLAVAPGVVAAGLVVRKRWALATGIAVELGLAAISAAWLAQQGGALPAYQTIGVPAADVLIAGLIVTSAVLERARPPVS
jgi:hypothetical protein